MKRGKINPQTGNEEYRSRTNRKEARNARRTVYTRERLKRIMGPVVAKQAYADLCALSTNPNNSLAKHPRKRGK